MLEGILNWMKENPQMGLFLLVCFIIVVVAFEVHRYQTARKIAKSYVPKVGDEVYSGGIFGTITKIDGNDIYLNVKIKKEDLYPKTKKL